jgi:hypothetical protein
LVVSRRKSNACSPGDGAFDGSVPDLVRVSLKTSAARPLVDVALAAAMAVAVAKQTGHMGFSFAVLGSLTR